MRKTSFFSYIFGIALLMLPLASLRAQEEQEVPLTVEHDNSMEGWHESIANAPESYQLLEESGAIALYHFLMADARGQLTAQEHALAEHFRKKVFSGSAEEIALTQQYLQPELLASLIEQLPSALFLANRLDIEVHQMALALHALYMLQAQELDPIDLSSTDWTESLQSANENTDSIFAGLLFLVDQVAQKKWHYHPYFDQLAGNDLVISMSVLRAIAALPSDQQELITRHLFSLHPDVDAIWHAVQQLLPFAQKLPATMQQIIANPATNSIYQDVLALLETWQILHLQSAEEFDATILGMHMMFLMMQLYMWYQPIGEVLDLFAKYLFLDDELLDQITALSTMNEDEITNRILAMVFNKNSDSSNENEDIRNLENIILIFVGSLFGINYAITPDMDERYESYLSTFAGIRYLAIELLKADLEFRHYMQQIQQWYDLHRETYTLDTN